MSKDSKHSKGSEINWLASVRLVPLRDRFAQGFLNASLRSLEVVTPWSSTKFVRPPYYLFDSLLAWGVSDDDVELIRKEAILSDSGRVLVGFMFAWLVPAFSMILLDALLPAWTSAIGVILFLYAIFVFVNMLLVISMSLRMHARATESCLQGLRALIKLRISCDALLQASESGKSKMIRRVRWSRRKLAMHSKLSISLTARVVGRKPSDDDFFKVARHGLWLRHARLRSHDVAVLGDAIKVSIQQLKHLCGPNPWMIPEVSPAPINEPKMHINYLGRMAAAVAGVRTVLITASIGVIPAVITVLVKR